MLNFIIFLSIYFSLFLSSYSYGKLIKSFFFTNHLNQGNEYSNLFFGISFFIIFSWIYSLTGIRTDIINLIILISGLILFPIYFKKIKKKISFFLIPCVLLPGVIIYSNHNDFYLYHLQNLLELSGQNITFGLANLNIKYLYSSLIIYFETLMVVPHYSHEFINIPRFLVYVSICGYLFFNILLKNDPSKKLISSVFLIFFLIKFRRFSEHGYDYIAAFYIIFLFIEYFYTTKIKHFDLKAVGFFYSIAVSIKITSLFFFPFIVYYFYIYILSYRNFRIRYLIKYFNPTFLVTLIFVVNSFINSGCLFYPVKKTCLTNDQVSWSVNYEKVKKEKKIVEKWAKGFYHQKNEIINDYEEYSDNFKWIKNWFKSHFLIKIIEPLILFIFICFICFNLNNYKLNFTKEIKNRKFLLLSLASIIFWLSQIPQFRFGFIYIFLFIFLFILNYFEKKSLIKDKIIYFIFLSVIFYNFANFNRIYKDFILNKSSVFPFYQIKNYSVKKKNYYKEVYYKILRNDEAKISLSQNDKNLNNYENLLFEEDQVKIKKIGKIKIISYFPQ